MGRTYENFDVELIASGATYEAAFRSIPGEPRRVVTFPLEDHELSAFMALFGKQQTRRMESPEFARVRAVGQRLFDSLFSEDVRQALSDATRGAMAKGHGLRVRIDVSQARDLGMVPWEYMYFQEYDDFVSLSNWTPVVRYLNVAKPLPPVVLDGPLRILAMISDPIERRGTLDVEREWTQLEEALAGPSSRGEIELHRLADGQLETLQVDLQKNDYHVFHFIGHGEYSEDFDDGVLALEDSRGREVHVTGATLGTYLKDSINTRLVVLNNCEGATYESDPFTGSAQSLLKKGIPAVVAMQFEITDRAAIDFARGFYTSVGNGFPVDAALAEARKVIRGGPTLIEFGSPVLYLSADDGTLFVGSDEVEIPDDVETTSLNPVVVTALAASESEVGETEVDSVGPSETALTPPVETAVEIDTKEPVSEVDTKEPPVEIDTKEPVSEVDTKVPPVEKPEPGPHREDSDTLDEDVTSPNRRVLVFVGLALAAIFVSVVLMFGGDDDPDPGDTLADETASSSSTTPDTRTTTVTETTPPTETIVEANPTPFVSWSLVSDQSSLSGEGSQVMYDIVAFDGRWIAVGAEKTGDLEHPAIWSSEDGLSWNRLDPASIPTAAAGDTQIRNVVQLGERLVAAGVNLGDAAVWVSDDGEVWTSVTNESFGGPGSQAIRGLTVWEHGVVAVGWDSDGEADGAVWTSPDGVDWVRASDPTGGLGGPGTQRIHDAAPGGPGLVAVGDTRWSVEDGRRDRDAEIWTSVDGDTWDRVDNAQAGLAGEGEQLLNVVRVGPNGLLAAGYDWGGEDGKDAAVWSSTDGVTWSTEGDRTVLGGPNDQEIHGLTLVGTGWVAAGWTHPVANDRDAAIWASDDGTAWIQADGSSASLGGPGRQQVESVSAEGATVVAVGIDGQGETLEAQEAVRDILIWIGQPD